jgi:cytidylate kinase
MLVCTIAAEAGTPADVVAATIAARSGARFLDRPALIALARELDNEINDFENIEERVCSRLAAFAMGLAFTGAPEVVRELELKKTIARLAREVLSKVVREPSVILAPAAFAALQDHPSAVHLSLRAPVAWRIETYGRENLVDRQRAERAVKHEDHLRRTWAKALYHVDADDPAYFSLVVDASRVPADRVADAVLATAGVDLAAAAI